MIALTETLEAFAARRRKAQTDIEDLLRSEVERAVDLRENTDAWSQLLDLVEEVYRETYQDEAGRELDRDRGTPSGFRTQLEETLRKTSARDQHSVDRITTWLATAILSVATIEASADDPEDLFMEWVDMRDEAVRDAHRKTHGQIRPAGEMFDVDGVDMPYPGWPFAPIELWINCRCTLRPTLASEELVASFQAEPGSESEPAHHTGVCVVALPAEQDGVHQIGDEPKHVTLLFCGDGCDQEVIDRLLTVTEDASNTLEPFNASVSGRGKLGADGANVLFAEAHEFNVARGMLEQDETVAKHQRSIDTHPHFVPHLTLNYGEDAPPEATDVEQVTFDRLAVWRGDEQTEYPLGERQPDDDEEPSEEDETMSSQFAISDKPWNGSPSRFTDEQYKRSCILHKCDGMEKSCHSLPIKEPNGDLNRNAVHNAASRLGSVNATPEQKAKAKAHLRGAYKQLGEDPPDNIAASVDTAEAIVAAAEGDVKVPWHGVLAPEGVWSGDRRKFKEGSLTTRPLPLPLTWQKISDDGHKGNVTVATIETAEKVESEMRGEGTFLSTAEAAEVVDLIREFGRFGQSVDADQITADIVTEYDEDDTETEGMEFTEARISSSCIVPIPAFAEAWIALGTWADHDAGTCGCVENGGHDAPESEPMQVGTADKYLKVEESITPEQFVDVAPGRTEDGPGWLTHPVDTDRLRDYWVRGPGAGKIGWGTAGDFDRCRANVAEYVKPQHINGYCANRHYDALGRWPGRHAVAAETLNLDSTDPAEAISLTAAAQFRGHKAPAAWFANPGFTEGDKRLVQNKDGGWGCPLTVTDDGQVYGHLATWGTCHIGFDGQCVDPPQNCLDRGNFLTGYVPLDDGTNAATGVISIGGGHAPGRLRARPALEHYDSTSVAAADITAGYDDFGIWVAGWVRPGVDDNTVTALRASPLSGDWRQVGFNADGTPHLELVAALAVNVPGFGIPRTQVAASADGGQLSLVAAGVVPQREAAKDDGVDYAKIATAVLDEIEARQARKARMAALRERFTKEETGAV